jgi:methylmalonyl-CoA mutase N-terminal domain/subunit
MLTAQQPENNVVRVTLQALAAILGGTQSLHTNSRDEALSLPSEESVQIALRTQQIIAYESGVADSIDPLAGSYLVESWTDQIEQRAIDYIEKIDALGGALRAIESGYIQREIQESAYRAQQAIDRGEAVVVGVNRYVEERTEPGELLRIDQETERRQVERVRAVRAGRDARAWQAALDAVREGARGDANLVPLVIAAVEARATVGEVATALREVFGEYQETALD